MNINWWKIDFGKDERDSLLRAFDDRSFTIGLYTDKLEKQLAHKFEVPYVVVTNSGTSALTMALLAAGIKTGDQVLVPNVTWIATAQAAALLGAEVVLVDTLKNIPVMDLNDLKTKINPRVRAIIPVHYNGRDANVPEIKKIADLNKIAIIEDSCKAMFSKNMKISGEDFLGTVGDMGCFSMGMISLLPSCYGGFVVTRNRDLYEKLKVIRWHGVDQTYGEEYKYLSSNFKCSDLMSSLAISHLASVESKLNRLNVIYKMYEDALHHLDFISIIPVDIEAGEVPLLMDVKTPIRERLTKFLSENKIGTCNFHEPLNLAKYLHAKGEFINSVPMARESFHLPCGPGQTNESIEITIKALKAFKG